ncbi:MAG: hypothetical protein PHU93_04890, partial [Candidatus Gracilibacteria bacterium]|nr:hypothetical protein [Candidatus Gracilibacteria bacterium]
MTDNKETPGSGINSKNTQNDYLKEAIDLIEHNIQMEGSSALLYRSTANTFLQRNLKNQKQTQLYVEQIWAQIQESSRFNTTTVSQETITQIAKKTRSEFLKQLGVIEGQRDAIIYQLELEYSLDADQKKAIREKVANIPSKELSEYRLASKRYQMMVQMSRARNEVTPLLLPVTQRLEKLFGTNL